MGNFVRDALESLFIVGVSAICAAWFNAPLGDILLIMLIGEMVRVRNNLRNNR